MNTKYVPCALRSRVGFKSTLQRLRAALFADYYGTTEVVPFPSAILLQCAALGLKHGAEIWAALADHFGQWWIRFSVREGDYD